MLILDSIDAAIIHALSEDGRRSLRQLSRIVGVSTPTVSTRLNRLMRSGLISRIAPIYNLEKLEKGNGILLWLKVKVPKMKSVVAELTKREEVKGLFITSGEGNLLVKVFGDNHETINFISHEIELIEDVHIVSIQMITKTLKDEQGVIIDADTKVLLNFDNNACPKAQ